MFRRTARAVGMVVTVGGLLLTARPAGAQYPYQGGVGFQSAGFHPATFQSSNLRPAAFTSGLPPSDLRPSNFQPSNFQPGGVPSNFHPATFQSSSFHSAGFHPSFYPGYAYNPPENAYPSYEFESAPAAESGYPESYGGFGLSDSGGYQAPEPTSNVSPSAAPAQADSPAQVTVNVPEDALVWFDNTPMTSTGSVREFQSPTLRRGTRYAYEVQARWIQKGQQVTQTQRVEVTPGAHMNVNFPIPPQPTASTSAVK